MNTTTEQKRRIRNHLASRRRLAMSHGRRERVVCIDGPYAGQELVLSCGISLSGCSTATLRINNRVGRYVAKRAIDTGYVVHTFGLVWEAQS